MWLPWLGIKEALTGDTLCDPNHPIVLETFKFPDPVIAVALSSENTTEREKLHMAVRRLV